MNDLLIDFIVKHEHDDVAKLLLRQQDIHGFAPGFVVNQINGRRRAKEKLPTWYSNSAITYPPQQNLEQCSSEATAEFKASIVSRVAAPGHTQVMADLTGGFGIDSYFFSRVFNMVWHIEPDAELNQLASDNHALLNAANINHVTTTAELFLNSESQWDWIFIDPSRKSNGRKVVRLTDCEPDVVKLVPLMLNRAENILIKTSPLLDLKEGLRQLPGTAKVFVVSVENECREVLFLLQKDFAGETMIVCENLPLHEQSFEFSFREEEAVVAAFADPALFVYEPNAAILKAGAFKSLAQKTGLSKIAMNTHLYTSTELLGDFPGRIFRNTGELTKPKAQLPDLKANIISRNHPLSPDEIKKKFRLKDGGTKYVLAFSGARKKYLLVAERIK